MLSMAKDKVLFIDLSEKKTKSIAEAITSETSRKVMDHLAQGSDTEQKISGSLNLPISTVHYHLQKLMDVGLVKTNEFHYSAKGREVNHYTLASQYIIIAPSRDTNFKDKLKALLPVCGVVVGVAAILKIIEISSSSALEVATKMTGVTQNVMLADAPQLMAETAPVILAPSIDFSLWFLLGGICAILVYLFVVFVQEKIKKK